MTDLGKLLVEFEDAMFGRHQFGDDQGREEVNAARAAIESHVAELRESYDAVNAAREAQASIALDWQNKAAELRERAEKAEAAAQVLRDECAQVSEEFGLPPTIRPAEGEIRRMVERARRTEKAEEKLARVRALLVGYPGDAYGILPSSVRKALGDE